MAFDVSNEAFQHVLEKLPLEVRDRILLDPEHALEALELEQRLRTQKWPTKNAIPNIAQERALRCFLAPHPTYEGRYPFIVIFRGGNGVGKTHIMVFLIAGTCLGPYFLNKEYFNHQYFQECDELRKKRKFKLRIVCDKTDMQENGSVYTLIKQLIPSAEFKGRTSGGYYTEIRIPTTSPQYFGDATVIDIKTFDMDPEAHSGSEYDLILFNEPPPQDLYNENISRLRRGGCAALFLTPLNQAAFLKKIENGDYPDGEVVVTQGSIWENCFANDNEVLTENGWKLLSDTVAGDSVLTYNMEKNISEYQEVISTTHQFYSGTMIDVGLGILTTPDHRMLVNKKSRIPFDLLVKSAEELKKADIMLGYVQNVTYDAEYYNPFPDKISCENWCEFIGWYVSEGSCCGTVSGVVKNNGVYISQKNEEKLEILSQLLHRTKWEWHLYGGKNGMHEFRCYDKDLHDHLFPLGNCYSMHIPRYVFKYPKEWLLKLWNTLLITDGDGKNRYITTSKHLADNIQEILIKLSFRSSLRTWHTSLRPCNIVGKEYKTVDQYCVSNITKNFYTRSAQKVPYKRVNYSGIVSCVTVPNGTIMVRNNKEKYPLLTGNCIDIPGTRGVLSRVSIERMKRQWQENNPLEVPARESGEYISLAGAIFPIFAEHSHVIPPMAIQPNWNIYKILDPHDKKPPFCVWIAVTPLNQCYVIAEYPVENWEVIKTTYFTIENFVQEFERIQGGGHENFPYIKERLRIMECLGDPNKFADRQPGTGRTMKGEYEWAGNEPIYTKLNDRIDFGHDKIRSLVRYDPQRKIDSMNHPQLCIFSTCKNVIRAFKGYEWAEKAGMSGGLSDKIDQTWACPMACIRYFSVHFDGYRQMSKDPYDENIENCIESNDKQEYIMEKDSMGRFI